MPQLPVSNAAVSIVALISVCASCFAADDVIYTKNGDRITGEIKKLQNGIIHIDPPYGENVFQIDWDDVERVESSRNYVIETSGGQRVRGTIQHDPEDTKQIIVEEDTGPMVLERPEVVWVRPFDIGFWNRIAFSIDLGATVTKANSSKQANLNTLANYAAERWLLQGGFNLVRNTVGVEKTARWQATTDYKRSIRDKWFGVVGAEFLNSDELQLDLRTTVSPGVGRYLKRTNRMHWSVAGGGQWTNERFKDSELSAKSTAEAWAGTEISLFDFRDVSWLTQLKVSPGLSEIGRLRLDFNTDFKIDLPKDLYFRIGLRNNYDSKPLNDAPKNDYVFSMGVGWEL